MDFNDMPDLRRSPALSDPDIALGVAERDQQRAAAEASRQPPAGEILATIGPAEYADHLFAGVDTSAGEPVDVKTIVAQMRGADEPADLRDIGRRVSTAHRAFDFAVGLACAAAVCILSALLFAFVIAPLARLLTRF